MLNKFGISAREGHVLVMRISAGQSFNRADLLNLVAHLVVMGNLSLNDIDDAAGELEAQGQDSPESRLPKPAAPPPPPPLPPAATGRLAELQKRAEQKRLRESGDKPPPRAGG